MSPIQAPAQERLRSQTEHLENLVTSAPSRRDAAEWYRSIEDVVLDLYHTLPPGAQGYEVAQLFYYLTELRRRLADTGEYSGAELTAVKLGDVLRRLERRLHHDILQAPNNAAGFVFEQLGDLDAGDQAMLLGVSTKTLGTWKRGGRVQQNKDRVRLVAQLVSYLRSSMTQTGVLMWFEDESDALGGVTPLSLVASGDAKSWSRLLSYARGGRGRLAD